MLAYAIALAALFSAKSVSGPIEDRDVQACNGVALIDWVRKEKECGYHKDHNRRLLTMRKSRQDRLTIQLAKTKLNFSHIDLDTSAKNSQESPAFKLPHLCPH